MRIALVRVGRSEEGFAEVTRLLRVPFGAPRWKLGYMYCLVLLTKDNPLYDELLYWPALL